MQQFRRKTGTGGDVGRGGGGDSERRWEPKCLAKWQRQRPVARTAGRTVAAVQAAANRSIESAVWQAAIEKLAPVFESSVPLRHRDGKWRSRRQRVTHLPKRECSWRGHQQGQLWARSGIVLAPGELSNHYPVAR